MLLPTCAALKLSEHAIISVGRQSYWQTGNGNAVSTGRQPGRNPPPAIATEITGEDAGVGNESQIAKIGIRAVDIIDVDMARIQMIFPAKPDEATGGR
ncbi:hypothetical protein NKH61_23480 [Mesorhizobium sp. M1005]|uniref:hypothetical protein n=1 Tax=unclassified Mesorhizobium TaxID=325217 RepID=UPI00333B3A76